MARRRLAAVALAALALIAGCGDGRGKAEAPRPLANVVRGFETSVETGGCKGLAPYVLHSSTRGPDVDPRTPPTAEECTVIESLRSRVLTGFKAKRSRQFGPTAVVEGGGTRARSGEVVATVWARDRDGVWRSDVWSLLRPQLTGVAPASANFAGGAGRFVDAARSGDCRAFHRLLDPGSRLVQARGGSEARLCAAFRAARMRRDGFLHDLARDPAARPRELGATRDLGLFELRLASGRQVALILSARNAQPRVLDYLTLRGPT